MEKPFPQRYSPDNQAPADLRPPIFPGWTRPVEDYDAGIPARLVEGGLLCIVDPWNNMEIGDAFSLYWNNDTTPVWSTNIDANQKDQRLVFRIDEGHVVRGDAFPVFYRVLPAGAADPLESEPKWKLLVKLDPPGGFDEHQGTPGHSGLKYSIPQDIIDNGVGPEEAAAGVPITIKPYKDMRRNDRINVAWGTRNVYRTVAADEENQEIIITIPLEIIEEAEDSDALAVAYQVVDECGNYPGGYWRWSAVTHVLVDLNNDRLDPPLVLVNGFPVEEIDLAELAGNPVTVRVTANRDEHAVGDLLRLTWRGTAADSSPVIVGPLEETVGTIPYYYDFTIPNADVAAIAKGRASVSYVRIRSGEKDLPSKSISVTVIGDARQYLAPDIVEAVGGTLDPDLNFYTLSVPYYPGRTAGDEIIIICDGRTSTTLPTYHEVTAIVGGEPVGAPVLANLAKEQVKRLDGGSLTVYYSVNGQPESERLVLSVGVAAPSLPIPTVVEAPNDVLNPDDVNPLIGVNVHATHTATIPDDVVVLRWRGSSSNAPDQSRTLTGTTAGKLVPFTVPFRYVTENLNGTVDVSYSVTRGTTLLGNSVVRHLTVGSVLDLTAPSVKEANGASLNPVDAKDRLTVVIPDYGILPGDQVSVTWAGTAGGGSHTTPVQELPANREIDVPVSVIGYNLNKSVIVTYKTIRNNTESDPSSPLNLTVQSIPESELPPLQILEASAGQVDVHLPVTFRIDAWPFYRQGDRVWLALESDNPDGTTDKLPIWTASPINASEFNQKFLQRVITNTTAHAAWLRALPDGREIRVVFKVAFGGGSNEADAQVFPSLRIGVVPRPQWPRSKMGYLSWQNMAATETLHIPAWAFSKQGQQVWLSLEGRTSQGSSHNLPIDVGTTITDAEARSGLNRPISKSYFDQLGHNTTLRVVGQISLDGGVTRVSLRPLEVMFTQYFLLAADHMDSAERGRFVPDVPGSFAFVMPSAEMGPTVLQWGGSGITDLNIPVTSSQGAVRTIVVRAQRSMGGGPHHLFNNAIYVAGGGSTFMHFKFVMQDNGALPAGSYKGAFRAILKGWNNMFTQDVWVQVLIEK